MDPVFSLLLALGAAFAAAGLGWRAGRATAPAPRGQVPAAGPEAAATPAGGEPATPGRADESAAGPAPAEPPKSFHDLAATLDEAWAKAPSIESFRTAETLRQAVAAAEALGLPEPDLLGHACRGDGSVAVLALETLARRANRDHPAFERILLARVESASADLRDHAFQLLHASAQGPVVPAVMRLVIATSWQWDDAAESRRLARFLALRRDAGEALTFGEPRPAIEPGDRSSIEDILKRLPADLAQPLREELASLAGDSGRWRNFLSSFARILDPVDDKLDDGSPLVSTPELRQAADRLAAMLVGGTDSPIRCPLLTGEEGCGKSALLRLTAQRLQAAGFTVFEASGPDIVSGQCYLGDLENRVRGLLHALESERLVWLVPSLPELLPAGRTRANETGVFDLVLPRLLAGKIRMLAEVRPGALDKLAAESPRLAAAMAPVHALVAGEKQAIDLAAAWLAQHPGNRGSRLTATAGQLAEANRLANQFLAGPALPGRLFSLLRAAFLRAAEQGAGTRALDRRLLLETIAATTGMPVEMLDDSRPLDLEAVRALFQRRVMGQREAVDTLVARLAMIKAGLTDPTRPQGVFLFAGPTGTGKTELAKALATWLFGAPDRMIRLDMSELQGANLARLTGSAAEGHPNSLASRIRQQPFSVVLLDEFEKADASVWDLFLQVFDDGRLTDQSGNLADFRHSILILTTNLGAKSATGTTLGFGADRHGEFRPAEIEAAIHRAFRPEFVNRIDRVLCFRPLSRDTMRSILAAQLALATTRRGLRLRPWTLDFDSSATDFLLDQGFSPTLGARPLQRAIDTHLLGPLAEAIVRGEIPDGDEFVFLYQKDGRLQWDLASRHAPATPAADPELPPLSLRRLILQPDGGTAELQTLARRLDELAALVELDAFHERRAAVFAAMARDGFWTDPARFAVLGAAEYLDRIENAVRAARDSVAKLQRSHPAPGVVAKLAIRTHLLEQAWPDVAAGKPSAAWVAVRPLDDSPKSANLARTLAGMIDLWAASRGMRNDPLDLTDWPHARAIDGFAALRILEGERGVHLGEEGSLGETARVEVGVAPQAPEPAALLPKPLPELASRALDRAASAEIVRRYQDRPTPLVRDRRRGWRTGRLDLVLAGHFDIMGS